MEMIWKKDENSEAVSPVVGVMLMLVVTIIIAAVVSGFAGGLAGDPQTAPNMMLDVVINTAAPNGMGGIQQTMTFEQLSGDRVPTKDLQIITYHTCTNGTVIKMVNDAKADSSLYEWTDYYGTDQSTILPFLNDVVKVGYCQEPAAHFGNYTLTAGDIMCIQGEVPVTQFLGFEISEGDTIDVKVLHTPSDNYVYDKEVIII